MATYLPINERCDADGLKQVERWNVDIRRTPDDERRLPRIVKAMLPYKWQNQMFYDHFANSSRSQNKQFRKLIAQ